MSARQKALARTPNGGTPPDGHVPGDTNDALLELRADIEQFVDDSLRRFSAKTPTSVEKAVQRVGEAHERRFAGIETALADTSTRLDATDDNQKRLWAEVDRISKFMVTADGPEATASAAAAVAEANAAAANSDAFFHKAPEPTVLRLNSKAPALLVEVRTAVTDWLTEVGVLDAVAISTPGASGRPSNRITLSFSGDVALGSRRARNANTLLRNRDGSWRQLETAAGVQMFVGHDKNGCQLTRERDVKVLKRVLEQTYPAMEVRMARSDGIVSSRGRPLAMVEPQQGAPTVSTLR